MYLLLLNDPRYFRILVKIFFFNKAGNVRFFAWEFVKDCISKGMQDVRLNSQKTFKNKFQKRLKVTNIGRCIVSRCFTFRQVSTLALVHR